MNLLRRLAARLVLRLGRLLRMYLHEIHREDSDEEHHSHPRKLAIAVVLRGGYTEILRACAVLDELRDEKSLQPNAQTKGTMNESHLPQDMTPAQAIVRLVNNGRGPLGRGPIRPITEADAQREIDRAGRVDYINGVKVGVRIRDLESGCPHAFFVYDRDNGGSGAGLRALRGAADERRHGEAESPGESS